MSGSEGKDLLNRLIDDLSLDSSFTSIIKSGIRAATEDEAAEMALQLRGALNRMPNLLETMRRSSPREVAQTSQLKATPQVEQREPAGELYTEPPDSPGRLLPSVLEMGVGSRDVAMIPNSRVTVWRRVTDIARAFGDGIQPVRHWFSTSTRARYLAIDFGSASTLIYVRGKGIVLDEPSVVAIRQEGGPNAKRIIQAVGKEAKLMLGKAPGSVTVIRPMKDGVFTDFTVTEQMLKQFIKKVHVSRPLSTPPRIIICVPFGATQIERRAIRESTLSAGASEVYLIEKPMAAAIGADLPVAEAAGSMIVHIGADTTEVSIISLGGMVYAGSVRVGLDKFDEAIINYIRRNFGVLIGEATAEMIKKEIGSAFPGSEVRELEVNGRNLAEGIPQSFTVSSNEILEALTEPLNQIVSAVRQALEQTPPELGADIASKGFVLTGGGALLRNLDRLLMEETGLPVVVADDPLTCVVRGSSQALERMKQLGSIFALE